MEYKIIGAGEGIRENPQLQQGNDEAFGGQQRFDSNFQCSGQPGCCEQFPASTDQFAGQQDRCDNHPTDYASNDVNERTGSSFGYIPSNELGGGRDLRQQRGVGAKVKEAFIDMKDKLAETGETIKEKFSGN